MKTSRLPLLDAMKGIGCIAIVMHHLAVYGPMSEVVREAAPAFISALELYARLAVQMFFVLAGFLVAAQLAPEGQPLKGMRSLTLSPALSLIFKRYRGSCMTPFLHRPPLRNFWLMPCWCMMSAASRLYQQAFGTWPLIFNYF